MRDRYSIKSILDDLALPELAYAFKLAVGPNKLVIMLLAVGLICGFGWCLDKLFGNVVAHPYPPKMSCGKSGVELLVRTELEVWLAAPAAIDDFLERYGKQEKKSGVFSTLWHFVNGRFDDSIRQLFDFRKNGFMHNISHLFYNLWLCLLAALWAIRFHPVYSLFFFSAAFFVISLAGGAVCRCAALEYAQNEKPGLVEAFSFAKEHWAALTIAPLIPLLLMIAPAFIVFGSGLLMSIPYIGELIVGLLFALLFAAGLSIVCLGLGIFAGGLLLWPAVAYERTTGADALGRAICYVLNRPLWMIFYIFAAGFFGAFFYLLLRIFVFLAFKAIYMLMRWGCGIFNPGALKLRRIWPEPELFSFVYNIAEPLNGTEAAASFLIKCFLTILAGFFAAYLVNYLLCASTVVYALLRKRVDGAPVERISTALPYAGSLEKLN